MESATLIPRVTAEILRLPSPPVYIYNIVRHEITSHHSLAHVGRRGLRGQLLYF